VLKDDKLRLEYDRLIMKEKSNTNYKFHDPSKKRSQNEDEVIMSTNKTSKNVAEKLKKYKDYEDFLKNYKNHKIKHHTRDSMKSQGWEESKSKYGIYYDHYNSVPEEYKKDYHQYTDGQKHIYYDTKENHKYYSKSVFQRMKLQAKPAFKQMFSDLFTIPKSSDNDEPRPV